MTIALKSGITSSYWSITLILAIISVYSLINNWLKKCSKDSQHVDDHSWPLWINDNFLTSADHKGQKLSILDVRLEMVKAIKSVVFGVVADNKVLFKRFNDNPSFQKWQVDRVFSVMYT